MGKVTSGQKQLLLLIFSCTALITFCYHQLTSFGYDLKYGFLLKSEVWVSRLKQEDQAHPNHQIIIIPEDSNLYFNQSTSLSSMCSWKSTAYGTGQKVVSFSLFNKPSANPKSVMDRYVPGIKENLAKIRKLYPGWVMRLYTDINDESGILEKLLIEPDFFICNATSLPGIGDVTAENGMLWRFFPIGDPTVDVFLVRDLDSLINSREVSAVNQWLHSDKTFHTMRDHPLHNAPIMGGLWGAKNTKLSAKIRRQLLELFTQKSPHGPFPVEMDDQSILATVLYLNFKKEFMIHDSYLCEKAKDSVPFPNRRKGNWHFVGEPRLRTNEPVYICPEACRPSYGKDWIFC